MNNIVVINLGWLGDILLSSVLCQDIKKVYPQSKLIFIVSKPFYEVAKGIPGVDEVFIYDKKLKHKGFLGIFKFASDFPYKGNIDCSFIIHTHERSLILSYAIGSQIRVSAPIKFKPLNLLITHKYNYTPEHIHSTYKAIFNANYLKLLTGKDPQSTMKFEFPQQSVEEMKCILEKLNVNNHNLIGISPCSKDSRKNWTIEDASEFIKLINSIGYRAVITGTSDAEVFAQKLRCYTSEEFIDLTNKTSIFQLAALASLCKAFVSVDTGSMHISYSIGVPTICLFFSANMIKEWGPQDIHSNSIIYNPSKISGQDCFLSLQQLLKI